MNPQDLVLSIRDLHVDIKVMRGSVPAVRGMDLDVKKGEILGLVGESGCGKTTAMLSLARLLPRNAKVQAGQLLIDGIDMREPSKAQLLAIRGKSIAYIFQDPQASLNPVMKIKEQISEAILVKQPGRSETELEADCIRLLEDVQISHPADWLNAYPHQLSGGMKQRIMVAIALANSPSILVADEPTTSLDVTVQSEILKLLKEINKKHNMTVIFITHDLAVANKLCDRIGVMYSGKIVEIGTVASLVDHPRHPYTRNLWHSIPRIEQDIKVLNVIPGNIPDKLSLPAGCTFHPRCEHAQQQCRQEQPAMTTESGSSYACYFPYLD